MRREITAAFCRDLMSKRVTRNDRTLRSRYGTSATELFGEEACVVEKRQHNQKQHRLQVIWLEGAPGSGKQEVLWRLQKMGFQTLCLPYFTHALHSPHAPLHPLTTMQWADTLLSRLLSHLQQYRCSAAAYKCGLLFVHRSLVSLFVHVNAHRDDELSEWALQTSATLHAELQSVSVWCQSDPIRRSERLAERVLRSENVALALRQTLRETDNQWIDALEKSYATLWTEKWFDLRIPTTSTKQATAQLLAACGVQFEAPWTSHD